MNYTKLPKILQPFDCQNLIRLGKNNDGGYLVNKLDVLETKTLISLGVGSDWSFERDFSFLSNCDVEAYDASVDANLPALQAFFSNNRKLHTRNIGVEVDDIRLEDILTKPNLFLKCDIEGQEYTLLNTLIQNSESFLGLVIEFHSINEKDHYDQMLNFIGKMRQKLIHLHVNNYFYYKTEKGPVPDILELTFTSNSNIIYNADRTLPHVLDMPNNPEDSEFKIEF